jgi:hypothetical protein
MSGALNPSRIDSLGRYEMAMTLTYEGFHDYCSENAQDAACKVE